MDAHSEFMYFLLRWCRCTLRGYTEDEYQLDILDRRISEEENAHAESDRHGESRNSEIERQAKDLVI